MPRYWITIREIREYHFDYDCADEAEARAEADRVQREEGDASDYYEVSVRPVTVTKENNRTVTEYGAAQTTARVAAAVQRVDALLRNDETC